jgi:hypothetical protein
MLQHQEDTRNWVHKGMPIIWISDCYRMFNCPVLAKRYLMLALCEDAIRGEGFVSPQETGVYFRAVRWYGLSDSQVNNYAREIFQLRRDNPEDSLFPEWILLDLDNDWMVEYPSGLETGMYPVNTRFVLHLFNQLGERTGKNLERLAQYVLFCMPGCRISRRVQARSTDYDIVCSVEGVETDFRSELGRYFLCECKDWDKVADFTALAKFCHVLGSTKCRFGILFSKNGISGQGKTRHAEGEQLKVFQDHGMVVVVVDESDLAKVAAGVSFTQMLRKKYESIRLDLMDKSNNERNSTK